MPPDEFARWVTLMAAASHKMVQAWEWQYAAGYRAQEMVRAYEAQEATGRRNGPPDPLVESLFFRTVLAGISGRLEAVTEAAKRNRTAAARLRRAKEALKKGREFDRPNIIVAALDVYMELRHERPRRKPTEGEVLAKLPEVYYCGDGWKRQEGRVRKVIRCVRGD
jgi:hypothetical protein